MAPRSTMQLSMQMRGTTRICIEPSSDEGIAAASAFLYVITKDRQRP